jgi:transcriptional regulator with XRE-family HTH domain
MKLAIEYQRIKEIRNELRLTQSQFGKILGISTTADIERGKTRISGYFVMVLLRDYQINPLWLFGESKNKYLHRGENILPKIISTNSEGIENILMVNAKASAGYGQNIGDTHYYKQLPAFDFPLPEYRHASFRGFQISGDSMTPLVKSNDWVLAKAISSFDEIENGKVYIIVERDSIRLKEVKKINNGNQLELISWNPEYPKVRVDVESILEMWSYHSKISFGTDELKGLTLEKVYNEIKELRDQLNERY